MWLNRYVLLCGSGLCGVETFLATGAAFRTLPAIHVRMTFG
ncbi:MAG TPA: hypothetical protein VKU19_30190 [Bryobacteraceae bacterium]|nr:hypothetical protein [Bryobacteraceae bacterium]